MFFEHKALYRSIKGDVPRGYYTIPFGKGVIRNSGNNASIITYGAGVHWALAAIKSFPEHSIEVVDLRTLAPLDWDMIFESSRKTGKVLVLHEDTLLGGIGAEIASQINDTCFNFLDAPVKRSASIDTPVPFAANLEIEFLPKQRLLTDLKALLDF